MRMTSIALTLLLAATAAQAGSLEGLVSRAEVTGPRGSFVTEMVSLADGTARFVQTYPADDPRRRGPVELLTLPAGRAFQRSDKGEFEAAAAGIASFVLGHDAPRLAIAAGTRPASISVPAPVETGGGTVTITLADYRRVIDFELPFTATFVHSAAPDDRYVYRYTELLPFRVAPGSAAPAGEQNPAKLMERLADLANLARAHERVMAAHRAGDATMLIADAAERSTISGTGRLSQTTRDEQLARMRNYLGSIRFSRYEDTAVPVIALSRDGTLAWLACEMQAEGHRDAGGKNEPIAYGFSWVEHYARDPDSKDRRWTSIGIASSQRP